MKKKKVLPGRVLYYMTTFLLFGLLISARCAEVYASEGGGNGSGTRRVASWLTRRGETGKRSCRWWIGVPQNADGMRGLSVSRRSDGETRQNFIKCRRSAQLCRDGCRRLFRRVSESERGETKSD